MSFTDQILRAYLGDNAAGASPEVLDAVVAAAVGPASPYGNDPITCSVTEKVAVLFEHRVDGFWGRHGLGRPTA